MELHLVCFAPARRGLEDVIYTHDHLGRLAGRDDNLSLELETLGHAKRRHRRQLTVIEVQASLNIA